jgi:hypothetical protein
VPESDAIQHVADTRTHIHGRNLLGHINYHSCHGSPMQGGPDNERAAGVSAST